MALSSKISTIYIRNEGYTGVSGDWKYSFTTKDFQLDLGDINWNSPFDEALDASLRQNFRGFRGNISLDWEKLHNSVVTEVYPTAGSATMRDFLNDMATSLATDKDNGVEISFDDTNYDVYVPESISNITRYTNQIGRASSSLDFISQQKFDSIPAYYEAPSV